MDADLDLLLIYVFCIADDLLPEKAANHRRSLTDAEVVTLAVAQSIMGIPSDPRFIRTAIKRLGHLFPGLTQRSGFYRRRDRLAGTIEALITTFARLSPGWEDNVLLVDSTPVECARSRETVKRAGGSSLDDALANAADYGYCASHSRYFYGLRLHTLCAPDGTPRAMILTSPKDNERDICLRLLARVNRTGPLTVIGDKGYAGRQFETDAALLDATILRPRRKDEPAAARTSRRSANGSNRSTGPRKTSSPWNATAPAPCTASAPGSPAACSPSPPRSRSTTNSDAPAAPSSPTQPETVELLI